MRTARLVGLSPDGASLIVATDEGEELSIAADARLRAAVNGDRPRLGQLEFEMETSLSPRDIQTRIRGGATLEDVARVAGIPPDRVERFAAPVLAERDHIAITAMSSSVRRRGETSGHRNLRITVTERLVGRGIDIDTIDWDSFRQDDGRWTVTADYRSGEAERHAQFVFDPQGRFSVAANDEARWLLGEQSPAKGPKPDRRRPEPAEPADVVEGEDTEPTLDLSDELALVRATQEADEPTIAVIRPLQSVPNESPPEDRGAESAASPLDTLDEMFSGDEVEPGPTPGYAGLTDASAVPATDAGGWAPPVELDYPVEPGSGEEPDPEPKAESGPPAASEPDAENTTASPAEAAKPTRRKRAAVPSWDEIMFGGPRPPR